MFRNYTICLMLFGLFLLQACSISDKIKNGQQAYEAKRFAISANMLQQDYAKAKNDKEKSKIALKIAHSYRSYNQISDATSWYYTSYELYPNASALFQYGLMLKSEEKYKKAAQVFKKYIDENVESSEALFQLKSCKKAYDWTKEKNNISILSQESINTPWSEYSPVILADSLLLFTSDRSTSTGTDIYGWTNEKFGDLYGYSLINQDMSTFLKDLNTDAYEGNLSFANDNQVVYFTKCPHGKLDKGYCKIYMSEYIDGKWAEAKKVNLFGIDSCNVGHPWVNEQNNVLWFASDAVNGFGGKDLYYAEKKEGVWSSPINAGRFVNTTKNEVFPYLTSDNQLYFSSDGHQGMGGLDIFRAQKKEGYYQAIENLKPPFNSGADDFGIVFTEFGGGSKKSGFFTSSRVGGQGKDDIYKFQYRDTNYYVLSIETYEKLFTTEKDAIAESRKPLEGVFIKVLATDSAHIVFQDTVDNTYRVKELSLNPNTDYLISASKLGYLPARINKSTKNLFTKDSLVIRLLAELTLEKIPEEKPSTPIIDTPEIKPVLPAIELDNIRVNTEIEIPNIYYAFDKSVLRASSKKVLDELLVLFEDNPNIIVEIGAHTDARGSDTYNQRLSQQRAQSVVNYFLSKGVSINQIRARGYGETNILNQCLNGVECTDEEHEQNRRTTFKIVE